jgi:anti-sigma regulatory factor (Ser/Thr protein kinase)/CheY-like chemotaxis protein
LLVVDADPAVHRLLIGLLKRQDRSIQNVYDEREALDRVRSAPYDLVVAGQGGNGFDGLKLLRRMRGIRPDTKVILTGEQDPARVIGAIRERAYSYFHKPLAEGPLADMVDQALESSSWRDDIRMLSARPDWITLDVRCKLEAVERMTHFLREVEAGFPAQAREDIAAAFRELLLNAVEHGGGSDPRKRVRISLVRTAHSLIVLIQDPGKGFSMGLLPHAAISNPDDAPIRHVEVRAEHGQRPGGFGILMTRNLVDELVYNQRGNEVLFVKYLPRTLTRR